MVHSFDSRVAVKLDIESAIIIHNLAFWIKKNISNDKHFYNGVYWTYNTSKAWAELFPYMSQDKIKRRLSNMEKLGLIESGNFNQISFDRTKWYCITSEWIREIYAFHCAIAHNPLVEIAPTIPDSKPDSNTDNIKAKALIDFPSLLKFINEKTGRNFKVINNSVKQKYLARLKDGYKKEDIIAAVENAILAPYHVENGFQYLTPEFFSRSSTIDKYSQKPKNQEKEPEPYDNIPTYVEE